MHKGRRFLLPLLSLVAVLAAALLLYFLLVRPVYALEFFYWDTTLLDFNEGFFYHTALAWNDDGEVTLLPLGLGQNWITATALPEPRSGHAAAYHDWHLYVIGGDSDFGVTHNTVYYTTIDSTTHELEPWQQTTPLPTALYPDGVIFHDAVVLNDYVYVFGGKEDEGDTTYYDMVAFSQIQPDGTLGPWQATLPLPMPLFEMESAVLNGHIYVMGGADYQTAQSRREVYYTTPLPNGEIPSWPQTSAPLPSLGVGGYIESSVAVVNGRIYVYGGADALVAPEYSFYVHFAEPISPSGDILGWTFNLENLPQNVYASEGAAYESGLLLAVSGAWNNALDPSEDVRAALVYSETGQTGEWVSTLGLVPGRFYHTVVQDDLGWLYSIGGSTTAAGGRLSEVQIAPAYGGGGGYPLGRPARLDQTIETTRTAYAPNGTWTSPPMYVEQIEGIEGRLTRLEWNSTITNPQQMTVTMSFRRRTGGSWTDWSDPYPSEPGIGVTTTMWMPPTMTAHSIQYRVYMATSVSTTTPILNAARVGVLAPPDLVADDITVTGCASCPGVVPPNEPIQIEFTMYNRSTSIVYGNNFIAMVFITTTPDYTPLPPDLPSGCEGFNPPTVTCPFIIQLQALDFEENDPPFVWQIPYMFTEPGLYYLVGYVDYNDTPHYPPPLYDVREFQEFNNRVVFAVRVGEVSIYLPMVAKNHP